MITSIYTIKQSILNVYKFSSPPSHEGRVGDLETEKFNLVEEVVSLQDQVSALKTEMDHASKKVTEAEAEVEKVGLLRAKVDLLETEKRRLETKIVDLRVEVASTEISHNDSGKVLGNLLLVFQRCLKDHVIAIENK